MVFYQDEGILFNETKKTLTLSFDLSSFSLLPATFHLFFISERAVWNKANKKFFDSTSLRVSEASCDALCAPNGTLHLGHGLEDLCREVRGESRLQPREPQPAPAASDAHVAHAAPAAPAASDAAKHRGVEALQKTDNQCKIEGVSGT